MTLTAAASLALPANEIPWKQDFPVIVPEVRKLEAGSGYFTVPKKLTVTAPAGFDLTYLEKTLKGAFAGKCS